MKTAAEVRAILQEKYADYYEARKKEREKEIQRELTRIEALIEDICACKDTSDPVFFLHIEDGRLLPEVEENLIQLGYIVNRDCGYPVIRWNPIDEKD